MPTMQDVATLAGVSIATVSFVVNGTKNVAPATRARVTAAMAELGYHLVLWPSDTTGDDLDDLMSGGLIDGVIVMEIKMEDPRIDQLVQRGFPFTAIGRTRHPEGLSFVDMDFERTVENSIDYLETLGHEHLALVLEDSEGGPMAGYAPHIRTESTFLESCARRGLHASVVRCGPSTAGGREAAADVLAADPATTAILIMKDDSTFGLLRGLSESGLRVPDDVSVLSLASSTANGALHEPALTTMDSPGRELGRIAAESLIHRLEGLQEEGLHLLLPCTLHVAGSTARAPRVARRSA